MTISHCPICKVLQEDHVFSRLFQGLRSPSLRSVHAPMSGCRSRSLLYMDPSSGLPRLFLYRAPGVLAHLPSAVFLPIMDQVWKTEVDQFWGRPVLGPKPLPPESPATW